MWWENVGEEKPTDTTVTKSELLKQRHLRLRAKEAGAFHDDREGQTRRRTHSQQGNPLNVSFPLRGEESRSLFAAGFQIAVEFQISPGGECRKRSFLTTTGYLRSLESTDRAVDRR